jgi:hypothetical protein
MNKYALTAIFSVVALAPVLSSAESTTITPAVVGSAPAARVDFTVLVPPVIYIRIGTGNAIAAANNTTTDSLNFTVPGANVGDSSSIAGTGGDLTAGAVTVRVFSNKGTNVSLNSSVTGALSNGTGDSIPWSEINVASGALGAPTAGYTSGITHPTFSATTGSGTATTLAATGTLVRFEDKWTFTYKNTTTPVGGTYGSSVANNGRVTYTATQL